MATQFITNDKGEKTSVIIPIDEYEDLLHTHHNSLELNNDYKLMIDKMLLEEENELAKYTSAESIKNKFGTNG